MGGIGLDDKNILVPLIDLVMIKYLLGRQKIIT